MAATKQQNIFSLIKEDAQGVGNDKTRIISRGVKALFGAIYYDLGIDWVKKLMQEWDLLIKGAGNLWR